MNELEIYQKALHKWGGDNQTLKMFEEMSELQKELCKNAIGKKNKDEIAEEIADVFIMLNQMMMLHKCDKEVEEWKGKKLERLENRVLQREHPFLVIAKRLKAKLNKNFRCGS